jgi:hypothetical protein
MGWNDHVSFIETQCLKCDVVSEWEYWDEIGQRRYVGAIGAMVGRDATKSGKCPHCGSTEGEVVEDDDEDGAEW